MVSFLFVTALAFAAPEAPAMKWPQDINLSTKEKLTIFQPQVESLENNMVTARAAFKMNEGGKDSYGSFVMKADTLIDKSTNTVSFKTIKVTDLQIPTGKIDKENLKASLEKELNSRPRTVPYNNLLLSLESGTDISKQPAPKLKNEPPQIIFAKNPSLLIMISGTPVMGPTKQEKSVERVMNTSALILHQKDKAYYLWALERWFEAPAVTGPFMPSKSSPTSKYVMIKDDLVKSKTIDPLAGRTADGKTIYPPGVVPQIFVTTKPAELLQSEGDPKYSAVEKTGLLYMSNSPNSIFLESSSQNYYALISGRWFTSRSLQGPWSYANAKELPKDFAKIPVNSPVAEVLVSVPGTPQAKEAVIASQIPQTAQVPRNLKPKNITCDGKTKWDKISGTSLEYAENCNTPLIKVSADSYYAVQDGVWFTAKSESGPWSVAIAVPDQIYQIPTSSPLYYVTYVRIYSTSADYVVVGYTPGYHGTFVSADGTIVYGTGYTYATYVSGAAWYPPPYTYGFGVGYGWGYDDGFYMGFTMGAVMYPWGWGSCCWGGTYVNIDVKNYYTNWGKHTVITGPYGGMNVNTVGNTKFARAHGSDTIYAGHDGSVYRRNGKGDWDKYSGPNTWDPVKGKNNVGDLERAHTARAPEQAAARAPTGREMQRAPDSNYLRGGMRAGAGGGGGFRGGGGRR